MKKLFTITIIATAVFIAFSAFDQKVEMPSQTIEKLQHERYQNFINSVNKTLLSAQKLDDNNLDVLRKDFLASRTAYKQWEYLVEYQDPEFIRKYINGAPLPKQEENSFGPFTIEPSGMQILDEIIFGDEAVNEKAIIVQLLTELYGVLDQYKLVTHKVYDRVVLEAARVELIRMYTLGLTGFDVPASGSSISDAITVLNTMYGDLGLYKDFLSKINATVYGRVMTNLDNYRKYLIQHDDFDALDRMYIVRTYVNPIFADILTLHQESGIEMIHEVVPPNYLPPYNHLSDNLFAEDFLDFYGYIALPEALNSPQLVSLGRTLFFDPILSGNNKRACASCHDPKKGFTDGEPKSVALDFNGTVTRNAPTLINCVYSKRFFHDMRANALEDQIEHVLTSKKEFGTTMMDILSKVTQSPDYVTMFDSAFKNAPDPKINAHTLSFAISSYVSSLRSHNSVFDKYARGEINTIDPAVVRGYNLFMGKAVCGTCHFAPNFNGTVPPLYKDSESEVLGVPADPYVKKPVLDSDKGRYSARLKEPMYFYEYAFKTPTVRNIELTAPYMHNGAYKTLEDVVDFYNNGGGVGIGIVIEHQTLPFDSLSLNKQEMKDIVVFMKALTDTTNLTNMPTQLPQYPNHTAWNNRKIGGEY